MIAKRVYFAVCPACRGNNVALDIAAGLVYLHRHRVVHMDLKSNNILLNGDAEPKAKISDVGLARILPTSQEYLASSGNQGTWNWSAPEVILGHRCSSPVDIWSFGVVLWEICTGEPPVRGQLRQPNVPEECPQEIVDVMEACWDSEPSKRPSAAELLPVLQRLSTRNTEVHASRSNSALATPDESLSPSW